MKSYAKAPLRLGLAGGGTDVSPYTEHYGGHVLNTTINLFARVEVESISEHKIVLCHDGLPAVVFTPGDNLFSRNDVYDLHWGAYAWFTRTFGAMQGGLSIQTYLDVPLGSGLGTSSTLLVSILGALHEHSNAPILPEMIANLAYQIERIELGLAGGRQDQFAASLGGFQGMIFTRDGNAILEPLSISAETQLALENNLILYHTAQSRHSAEIIREQIYNAEKNESVPLEAMHSLKSQVPAMIRALTMGDMHAFADLLDIGFTAKKKMASGISNPTLDELYQHVIQAGATSGKISGAGGGGFMLFFVEPDQQAQVMKALHKFGGKVYPFKFYPKGLSTWKN